MNGFSVLSTTYKNLSASGLISEEESQRYCRIYDFLSTCDNEDFNLLFDSGAFNHFAKGYLSMALRDLIADGVINSRQGDLIDSRYKYLFSVVSSSDIY